MDDSRVPTSAPLSTWLAELAQPSGAPGGGAACGVMVGLAAALLGMVAEYTPGDVRAAECAARLVDHRAAALKAAEEDGIRSVEFGAALAMPADDPERDRRVRDAAVVAARSSAALGDAGRSLLPELVLLAEIGNPSLKADLAVAAEALTAGIAGACVNISANLQTARKYGASASALSGSEAAHALLNDAKKETAAIADQISARFTADAQ
ncbi:cyclodeaminase/cyclohydrolase family protein [Microbacterium aerolatum]|uniref:cyclodeaminase/cyclohydrolase family protein n=1 Tax=Microbacterium aerolatum TaxID=153731 RepID=UPI00200186CD|nr:cyclodeaminase/cyclohydrolase family protein [Microbacterium aerolatum]MCK3768880.1 cyclodeaminase/cyclohydrolase family protein [Microbacterium aerolatum]